jgi:hypothetical protein
MAARIDVAYVGLDLDNSAAGAATDENFVEELGGDDARVALVEGAREGGAWGAQDFPPNASLTPSGVSKGLFVPRRTLT